MMGFRKYFELEKKPHKSLFPLEWAVLSYAFATLLLVLFCYTDLQNPHSMIEGRLRIVAVTFAMWLVYRLVPCRFTRLLRVVVQFLQMGYWYADTYQLNLIFQNQDPFFASLDQKLFGCQPALLFAEHFPQAVVSELLDMGYVCYFPIIALVLFYYYIKRYDEFERTAFIVIASFFLFYLIYDLLPVTGPMYYYPAVGLDNIRQGLFPALGDYFATHNEMMTSPGYSSGLFYQLLELVHTGEHPTAAFPSSHVGIAMVCMLLLARAKAWRWFWGIMPVVVLLCMATVYIRAHYVVDALAGFLFGPAFYFLLSACCPKGKKGRKH